jgi:histone-lysine N-methyltransferase SETD3
MSSAAGATDAAAATAAIAARVHPAVEARVFPGMGAGLAATALIKAGELVLRLPKAAWHPVSADIAISQARQRVPQFVAHAEAVSTQMGAPDLAKHAIFALHLLFELGDSDSRAHPYLATLPSLAGRRAPSVPLLWTPAQVATLCGTPTHAAVLSRSTFVAAAHEALFPGGEGGVPLDAFSWALSSVLSRAASGAGMPYTLMPGIDLLNHGGAQANCTLGATRMRGFGGTGGGDDDEGATDGLHVDTGFVDIEVRCTKDVAPGQQLTISYGNNADNDRLLRLYGFTVPGNPNDRRQLELPVTGLAADCWNMTRVWGPGLSLARKAILRQHGLPQLDPMSEDSDFGIDDLMDEVREAWDNQDPDEMEAAAGRMEAVFRDPDAGFMFPGNSGGGPGGGGGGGGKKPPPPASDGTGKRKLHTSHHTHARNRRKGGGGSSDSGYDGHGDSGSGGDGGGNSGGGGNDDGGSGDGDGDGDGGGGARSGAEDTAPAPAVVTWRCYVAHPSKKFPHRRRKPMDSATDAAQNAVDVATSLASGEGGGAVSMEVLVAALRVHLLR